MRPKRFVPVFFALLPLLFLALAVPVFAQGSSSQDKNKEKKAEDQTTKLLIHVTGGEKKEAVANASVYLRFKEKGAILYLLHRKHKVELDLKTDNEGHASFPILPRGKVLVQVVAPGWQTFGEYFELTEATQTVKIHLHRPKTRWY
jgi:hypothetical protein